MIELAITGVAKGGDGVARDSSGRAVFVRGALPGDVVQAEIVQEKKRFARATISQVIEAGPGRVEPACGHVGEGCGGCDFQHVSLGHQRDLKRTMVVDALERIGHFVDPQVSFGGGVSGQGYRSTVRCAVVNGRAGFREHHSDRRVAAPMCTIAYPAVRELMATVDFGPADEVFIRVGVRTRDINVIIWPTAKNVEIPDAHVLGGDAYRRGKPLFIHEEMCGRRWRVSARSFLQSSPEAAELVVGEVRTQLAATRSRTGDVLCDLYSGIGLFAGSLGHDGPVVAVEGNRAAVEDARLNLTDLGATVEHASINRWHPKPADIVIADPARSGLGDQGVAAVVGTGAAVVVLVSCDAAACARDARLLVDSGFQLEAVTVLDLFPQTSHVEVVSRFSRSRP